MTPKVKPTVEKWEKVVDLENLAYQIVYKIGDEIIPTGVGTLTSKRLVEEIEPILTKAISLSVQEAKAEMIEKIERRKVLSIAKYGNMPAPHDPTYKEGYNQALDDLLASLKQEEQK